MQSHTLPFTQAYVSDTRLPPLTSPSVVHLPICISAGFSSSPLSVGARIGLISTSSVWIFGYIGVQIIIKTFICQYCSRYIDLQTIYIPGSSNYFMQAGPFTTAISGHI